MTNTINNQAFYIITFTLFLLQSSVAYSDTYFQLYHQDHNKAVNELVKTWANNGSNEDMARATMKIIKFETSMITESKTLNRSDLVLHLANDDLGSGGFEMTSSYDFPVFAYRVFKHKVMQITNFKPDIKALFYKQQFEIYER